MTTISIINLKGGVGKTISAINIAFILAVKHGKRVLLVDNDKQGNTCKFFGLHSNTRLSMSELLTKNGIDPHDVVLKTKYSNLDVIPANMSLVNANREIMLDMMRSQHNRLSGALNNLSSEYDVCIIDNAPDINMATINALAASDHVLVPIKMDQFALDGLDVLLENINKIKGLNSGLHFSGCFVTVYSRSDESKNRELDLQSKAQYKMFKAHIRRTEKVNDSTYAGKPITIFSKRCGASHDYIKLVDEIILRCKIT